MEWNHWPGSSGIFITSVGKIWMNRNLGASQVATSVDDTAAYGDLYQWGRGTDGHEKRTSLTETISSTTDTPDHSRFIISSNRDWRMPQKDNLWQGLSGINNPCPTGFRLPTETELVTETTSWGATNQNPTGAFASPLKLVAAGLRDYLNGDFHYAGWYGGYWSSTVDGSDSHSLHFYFGDPDDYSANPDFAGMGTNPRATGFSVRCIKD
jgi:uncharacterized protein (TIGR02145 family)